MGDGYKPPLERKPYCCDGCGRIFAPRCDETVCDWCDPSERVFTMDEWEREHQP